LSNSGFNLLWGTRLRGRSSVDAARSSAAAIDAFRAVN